MKEPSFEHMLTQDELRRLEDKLLLWKAYAHLSGEQWSNRRHTWGRLQLRSSFHSITRSMQMPMSRILREQTLLGAQDRILRLFKQNL